MFRIRSWGCAFFAAIICLCSFPSVANEKIEINFRRGVALFHPLVAGSMIIGSRSEYMPEPFSDAHHQLTSAQLAAITAAGFDFVRVPVDPGPFLQFKGARLDQLYEVMRQKIEMILSHGFLVIVDFHPNPLSETLGPHALVAGSETPIFNAYCDMLVRTAQLLNSYPSNKIALEILNEPEVGWSRVGYATWQAMIEKAYLAIRTVSPHMVLVVSGGNGGNAEGLVNLKPTAFANDQNVIFSFHHYWPYEFTMQSLEGDPIRGLLLDVPYPAQERPLSDSLAALSKHLDRQGKHGPEKLKALAQTTAKLTAYRLSDYNRTSIRSAFDRVAAWADKHSISRSRIFLGEFGTIRRFGRYNGTRDSERARWLRDIREEAEAHGFFWSIWTFSGSGGMAIVNNEASTIIDHVTLEALGLK